MSANKKIRLNTKRKKIYLDKNIVLGQYTFDNSVFKFDSTLITFDRL
jgi:hypothetical protein